MCDQFSAAQLNQLAIAVQHGPDLLTELTITIALSLFLGVIIGGQL